MEGKTIGAWHIPYNKDTYQQLIRLFPDIELPPNPLIKPFVPKSDMGSNSVEKGTPTIEQSKNVTEDNVYPSVLPIEITRSSLSKDDITLGVMEKSLILKMPRNEADIQFIRTFKYVRWDNRQLRWIIPNYGKNLELLKNYFNVRISRIESVPILAAPPRAMENPDYLSTQSNTILPGLDAESLKEIEQFRRWMEHKRYSDSTVKTYIMAITTFLRFIKPKTSAEATNEDMQRFVYHYMIPKMLSFSYQNQAVNASKLFFKIIKDSVLITEQLERPRREHKLPNVMSKEEGSGAYLKGVT